MTGVTELPLFGEALLERPAVHPATGGAAGLPRIRWAQWHEELRDRADAHTHATGSPPTMTLVLLDASRASVAQAERMDTLLAPAGIATVIVDLDVVAAPDLVPVVVCVCGSTDATADEVLRAVDTVRGTGVGTVVVAAGEAEAAVPGATEMITDGWTCWRSTTGCRRRWGWHDDRRLGAPRLRGGLPR